MWGTANMCAAATGDAAGITPHTAASSSVRKRNASRYVWQSGRACLGPRACVEDTPRIGSFNSVRRRVALISVQGYIRVHPYVQYVQRGEIYFYGATDLILPHNNISTGSIYAFGVRYTHGLKLQVVSIPNL